LRKLIESTFVSLNGVVEDPSRWAMAYFDEAAAADSLEALVRCDAMLMGRGTYEYLGLPRTASMGWTFRATPSRTQARSNSGWPAS
jgi:hypothetical protein